MPTTASQETTIKMSDGQVLVLTPGDKLEQSTKVTVACDGPRCAARNNIESPKSFTYDPQAVEGDDFKLPEESDNFISLVISVRSPSYRGVPLNMCGPQCVKDFLTYAYLAAGPRNPETVQPPVENIPYNESAFAKATYSGQAESNPSDLPAGLYAEQCPVLQADGDPGDEHQ